MNRTMLSPHVVLGAVLLLATLPGCSRGAGLGETCLTAVDQIGCAGTFELQVEKIRSCAGAFACCALGGPCGAYRVWRAQDDSGGLSCVYDGSGQQLLSAIACSDQLAYCGNTQFCASGGQPIDPSTSCDLLALPPICPGDAGVDASND